MNIYQVIQIVVALGLLNVWLIRANKSTGYRGGEAQNIKEEFAIYGLPEWMCYLVGFLKVSAAIALLLGVWIPVLVLPAAGLIAFLMLGAVVMHFKVSDPIKKTVPAICMLAMNLFICAGAL